MKLGRTPQSPPCLSSRLHAKTFTSLRGHGGRAGGTGMMEAGVRPVQSWEHCSFLLLSSFLKLVRAP